MKELFIGIDLVELGMILYLMICIVIGILGVYRTAYQNWMLFALWVNFLFFSGLFLVGVASVTSADNLLVYRIEHFFTGQ